MLSIKIIHRRKDSPAQAGRTIILMAVGRGTFMISHISLAEYESCTFTHARRAHVGFEHKKGDGTFWGMNLDSGYIMSDLSLNFNGPVEICGPGNIYGVVFHTEATDRSLLVVTYRRVSDSCQGP